MVGFPHLNGDNSPIRMLLFFGGWAVKHWKIIELWWLLKSLGDHHGCHEPPNGLHHGIWVMMVTDPNEGLTMAYYSSTQCQYSWLSYWSFDWGLLCSFRILQIQISMNIQYSWRSQQTFKTFKYLRWILQKCHWLSVMILMIILIIYIHIYIYIDHIDHIEMSWNHEISTQLPGPKRPGGAGLRIPQPARWSWDAHPAGSKIHRAGKTWMNWQLATWFGTGNVIDQVLGSNPKDAEMEPEHPKTIEVTDRLRIVRWLFSNVWGLVCLFFLSQAY